WEKILHVMNELEGWRNPEMSLNSLSEQVLSNRTYVGDAFKRNTGMTFSEYVTKRRIDDVVAVLTRNPESQIQEAFLNAGYRQRSTAWKNFHKIMGVSPTEFVEKCR
ncbi:MAG: AraC family transcriptional regulator, partial [Bacteroidales bacterium]|nr:AraC family transcriptional regulator [Bacteroidales bacterium]